MAIPVKRVNPEKVAIIHHCTQEDRVKRIELILVGNGHPEEGYIYKVIEMAKSIKEVNEHLTGISGIVKELHEKSVGSDAVLKRKDSNFERALKVLGVIIMAGMFVLGYLNLIKKTDQLKDEVNMINTPVRTRSGVIELWPSGVVVDSLNKADNEKY